MEEFFFYGALEANSPFYVGRTQELETLLYTCMRKVRFYTMVLSSRQMGKTSLLVLLRARLPKTTASCWLNFQSIPGATTPQMLEYLKNQIVKATRSFDPPGTDVQPTLYNFDDWLMAYMPKEPNSLVLCMDELGALPLDTRADLANLLRSLHHKRLEPEYAPFFRLVVILFGGIDLHELATTSVSTLSGVCENLYLNELSREDTFQLLGEGLKEFKLPEPALHQLSHNLYRFVEGHPYLTQCAGYHIAKAMNEGKEPNLSLVSNTVRRILKKDPYFTNLKASLIAYELLLPLKDLLERSPTYRHNSNFGLQLELLGAIKSQNKKPVPRNSLLRLALKDWFADIKMMEQAKNIKQGVTDRIKVGAEFEIYSQGPWTGNAMDYKLGLNLLKESIQGNSPLEFAEFLTLEERFYKNEHDELIYGSSENRRSTRSQVIFALNEMALRYSGVSFNELCQGKKVSPSPSDSSYDAVIDRLGRIETKIDLGQAQDRETAVQILDALAQNQLESNDANQIMLDLQDWARKVQESGQQFSSELTARLDALAVHTAGVNQYFQVAIPVIPGILSYNVELGSQHQVDLKAVWAKIVAKTKRKGGVIKGKPGGEKLYGSGNRWAVIVGVDQYEDHIHYGELHVCAKDAQAVHDQLIASGYQKERIKLITDQQGGESPTRDNILVSLKSVALATEPDDILIFFYSGHGDEEEGESYLVARNGKRMGLEDTAVRVSRIKKVMEQAKARAKVIILDACHSGANIEGKGPVHMSEEFIRRVFEQAEGLAIIASCNQGQVSYEWQANGGSVFTYYLLEALQGQADLDSKGFVTVQDANRHVSNGVKLWASQRNLSQTPTLQLAMAGDIILTRTKA